VDGMKILNLVRLALLYLFSLFAAAQHNPTQSGSQTPLQLDLLDTPAEPEVRIPNFTSCSLAELKKVIADLAHLKPSQDQSHLIELLDHIGATTIDIAWRTPNLISNNVIISQHGTIRTRQNYSFLVLQHISNSNAIVLEEFRVDTKIGEEFATEENTQSGAPGSVSPALELPTTNATQGSVRAPATPGFFNQWLNFYPPNRRQAEFRYLGEQKLKRTPHAGCSVCAKSIRCPVSGNHCIW